jgi:hypothetical protein
MVSEKISPYAFIVDIIKAANSWRKVFVLCILLLFGSAGGTVYFFRQSITLWIDGYVIKASLNINEIDILAKKVITDTQATKVTVWSVDLTDNYREIIYSREKSARQEEEEGTAGLLFTDNPGGGQFIVSLIERNILCSAPAESGMLAEDDINNLPGYVCVVELPPGDGIILGFMVVSYPSAPDQPELLRKRLLKATRAIIKGP